MRRVSRRCRVALVGLVAAICLAGCSPGPATTARRGAGEPRGVSRPSCGKPGAGLRMTLEAVPGRAGDRVVAVELSLEGMPASSVEVRFAGLGAVEVDRGSATTRVRIGESGRASVRAVARLQTQSAEPGMVLAHATTDDGRTQEVRLPLDIGDGSGGFAKPAAVRTDAVDGVPVRIAPSG